MTDRDTPKWITMKEAMKLSGKSEATIRRLMKKGDLKPEKRKMGGVTKNFFSRYELLNALSERYGERISERPITPQKDSAPPLNERGKGITFSSADSGLEKVIAMLEDALRRERETVIELKKKVESLRDENKKLNEEIKGILRGAHADPRGGERRGIMGYLVERIMG